LPNKSTEHRQVHSLLSFYFFASNEILLGLSCVCLVHGLKLLNNIYILFNLYEKLKILETKADEK
uniref:Uncharacterized protein n=1 Tax=Sinocyclocheilus rhinocerous TaxID=307959 RepID=A0A673GV56_9TELE